MDDLLSNIEKELYDQQEDEVSSMTIGEMVVERLIDIDEVAYIRFASVYRDFDDVDSFMAELKRIRPHHK